jgi:anaerobic magnesium-protoporphyrin IX monomethyl ester cyclase
MVRILLVNPHESDQSGFTNPPLGLLYIAGTLLKNGFDVHVLDACIEGKSAISKTLEELRPNLVGVTCLTPARKNAFEVAAIAKSVDPNIKVVMGGAHATIMYNQVLENYPYIDYVVLGEGEMTFLEIAQGKDPAQINGLAYKENGKVVKNPPRKYAENLDDLPFPAWHLVDLKKYPPTGKKIVNGIDIAKVPRIPVVFSRGCKGHCDFCSTWWIWRGWRHRSPKKMVDEIELLNKTHGIQHFWFADDAMTIDRNATIELCEEIVRRQLKIAFSVTTRTDCVDELVLQKLKEAGCYQISYGVETGSPILLEKMGKENDVETSKKAIRLTKKAGLEAVALMIVGNIGETKETLHDTMDFLRETDPDEIGCVGGLWVLPGTKLFEECKAQGFINDDFWLTDEPYKLYTLEYTPEELKKMQKLFMNYNYKARIRRITRFISVRILKTA